MSIAATVANSASTTTNIGNAATNAANIAAGQSNLNTSYSDFLTLLTTQLQNQDPTSPMDTNAFTQQLVSMTGVQQQLLTNELLQQMVTGTTDSISGSVGLIGQNVTATSSTAALANGAATWTYSLPTSAAAGNATISNAAGAVVWTGALSSLAAGANTFSWNGQDMSGNQLPNGGAYTLSISATNAAGAAVTPTLSISGKATAVEMVSGVPNVTVNGAQVPVSAITSVAASSS
jgi:flagellar basal-body rod modification protein FlgD